MRRRTEDLPAQVDAVRRRIERWRSTRRKRTRMPVALWQAAVSAAREHGLWAVSRALRVNYESLKQRLAEQESVRDELATNFVEMDVQPLIGATPVTVIKLSDADGARMTIHLPGQSRLELQGLVDGFWRRGS